MSSSLFKTRGFMLIQYKEQANKSGIYFIRNVSNNRMYVGSCKRFKTRFSDHINSLNKNKHRNKFLQNDWNKCGREAFVFEVVEVTNGTTEERRQIEQQYIDKYFDNKVLCYNMRKNVVENDPSCFSKDPEETKRKRSASLKGRKLSPESIEKIRIANIGRVRSEETRKKISETSKGREPWHKGKTNVYSEEQIKAISDSVKRLWDNKDYRNKTIEKMKGAKRSKDTIDKMSKRMKGENHPMFGKKHKQESIEKIKKNRKGKMLGLKHPNVKKYENIRLLSPDNVLYTEIHCLADFCRLHNLRTTSLCAVLKKRKKSTKGWRLQMTNSSLAANLL